MHTTSARRVLTLAVGPLAVGPLAVSTFVTPAAAEPCEWSGIGEGFSLMVHAVALFDDGGGPALYAGLSGAGVARWDGTDWLPVGGFDAGTVVALTMFDDGSGAALYAGGAFSAAGAVAASRIARWDGAAWSPLGTGMNLNVGDMTVFDDGAGPALYIVGNFTSAGGMPASRIARWDGQSFSALGDGLTGGFFANVNAVAALDGLLYVGGFFTTAGGAPASNIARWNPATQTWSALGAGMDGIVVSLGTFDDGGGAALYAGGTFETAGGVLVNRIARWDGELWWALGTGIGSTGGVIPPSVNALAVVEHASGPALYVGGEFEIAGGLIADNIAKWEGDLVGWSTVGDGVNNGINDFAVRDESLYVGGWFTVAGGQAASRIARWSCEPKAPPCYANCDGSTMEPILTVDDFTCFINEFAAAQGLPHEQQVFHYANCDGSTVAPVLTVDDFTCFINAFAQGCP